MTKNLIDLYRALGGGWAPTAEPSEAESAAAVSMPEAAPESADAAGDAAVIPVSATTAAAGPS